MPKNPKPKSRTIHESLTKFESEKERSTPVSGIKTSSGVLAGEVGWARVGTGVGLEIDSG